MEIATSQTGGTFDESHPPCLARNRRIQAGFLLLILGYSLNDLAEHVNLTIGDFSPN